MIAKLTWGALALVVLLGLVASCGSSPAPLASSSSAVVSSTTTTAPTTSETSGAVTSLVDQVTIVLARLDEATPPGKILKVTDTSKEGEVGAVWYLDPTGRRIRHDFTVNGMPVVQIFDDTGNSELVAGVMLTVSPHGGGGYDLGYGLLDHFAGMEATKTGTAEVKGQEVIVCELSFPSPDPAHTLAARFYIDPSTGLRMREEKTTDGTVDWISAYEIIDTSQLEVSLDWHSLEAEAAAREERAAHLSTLPFPVYGLPEHYLGLHLEHIVPGIDWRMVRLEYLPEGGSVSAVVVSSYNLAEYPDYPENDLKPLSSALATSDLAGTVLRFGQDGVGILLQVVPKSVDASIQQIAAELVRIN